MKKTLLSIMGLLLMGELTAGHSKVTFYSSYGEPFVLTVNGERINHQPATRVYLDNLHPGNNHVRIKVHNGHHITEFQCPVFLANGYHSDFAILPSHHRGYTLEQVASRPLYHKKKPVHYREYYYEGDRYKKDNAYQYRQPSYEYNRINLDDVLYSLSCYHFDREKLRYAKSAVSGRALYTREVAGIMRHFSFDKYRLEFASYAYRFTIDKENYFKVKKAFSFKSTARALDKRIYY